MLLPLDILDHRLKDFVNLQRKHLLKGNNDQLARFKELIHEKDLFQNLLTHQLTVDHVWNQSRLDDQASIHTSSLVSLFSL